MSEKKPVPYFELGQLLGLTEGASIAGQEQARVAADRLQEALDELVDLRAEKRFVATSRAGDPVVSCGTRDEAQRYANVMDGEVIEA